MLRSILRWIANLLISGLILWGASKLLPEKVIIDDFTTLLVATISIWVVNIIINTLASAMVIGGIFLDGCGCCWLIVGIFILAFSKIITLVILSAYLPGFIIKGFWLKVVIAILCSMFSINAPSRPEPQYNNYYHEYDPRY